MKIYVNRIPEEGLHEETSYDPKALDMDRPDVHVDEPIALSSFITKHDREVVARVEASCQLRLCCARCLEEFTTPLRTAATLSYAVKPTDIVDITDDVRQEIVLAYPMVPVCRPSCKGLCPVCGQNLNVTVCAHQQGV